VRELTVLTQNRIAAKQSFLDWDTQPAIFKHYPQFCYRVSLDDFPSLQWLRESRKVTDGRMVENKPYRRLNVPSAGNLHPIEIYVQLRNVTGLLSGIYHLDVLNDELVMIAEIAGEGIEPYLGMKTRFSGVIVMLTLVPFRSSWKYGLRAWRYLYLDLGHQLGALAASVRHFGHSLTKMYVDMGLNQIMGMGNDEVIAAVYGVGECSNRTVKMLSEPLMRVQPTDYTRHDEKLYSEIQTQPLYSDIPITTMRENFIELNHTRRSAREFNAGIMDDSSLITLMQLSVPRSLEIVFVVLQARSMHHGIYRNGKCDMSGNFLSEIVHLLLDQRFIAGANMVVLIYAEHFNAASHVEAGVYAQELYTACEYHSIGCSGIGAFYDYEASLWSDKSLLYAVAIGGKNDYRCTKRD
jgi:SagB-type dehydrogenase family enzyme